MTEKEAWLKIGAECMDSDVLIFLCHETSHHPRSWSTHFPAMRKRLALLVPERLYDHPEPCHDAWWGIQNEVRATACGFLAAMCDDD